MPKILDFGSLNIDYVYEVPHFVKKGETLLSTALHKYTGGKGLNQSVACSRAGAKVWHAGCIGEDGAFLKEYLEQAGVDTSLIETLTEVPTGHAVIQNDREGDNCILLYGGANQAVTEEMIDRVLSGFDSGDFLILQNEISRLDYLTEQALAKGMILIVNPSPVNEELLDLPLEKAGFLLLNEIEAAQILAHTADRNRLPEQSDEELLEGLARKFPDVHIVLTLGERGSRYAYRDERIRQAIFPVQPVDTTAAGDTFTGYFVASVLEGRSMKEAMERAALASSIAVGKAGAAPSIPRAEELEQALKKQ